MKNLCFGKCCQQPTLQRSYAYPDNKVFKLANNVFPLVLTEFIALSPIQALLASEGTRRRRWRMVCKAQERNSGKVREVWGLSGDLWRFAWTSKQRPLFLGLIVYGDLRILFHFHKSRSIPSIWYNLFFCDLTEESWLTTVLPSSTFSGSSWIKSTWKPNSPLHLSLKVVIKCQ